MNSNSTLQAALDFYDAGVSVVPANTNGSKSPIGSWKQYQVQRADREQLIEWFKDGHEGIGIITGAVSGNLEMVEAEGRAVHDGLFDKARDFAINNGMEEIWNVLTSGYVEMTPSGGLHFLYRIIDEPVPGNTKIARRPGEGDSVEVLFETRGSGGFVVTAPSHGEVHPSGQPWVLLAGSPASIPMFSMEERNALHRVFATLDSMPAKESYANIFLGKESAKDDARPGSDFNNKATWDEILIPQGWTKGYTSHGTTTWTRPGKSASFGYSATTGRNDGDNLYVFSTSTTFEAERPYSKFAAYAHLYHADDFSAASRDLRSKGYGSNGLPSLPSITELQKPNLSVVPNLDDDKIELARERSSWFPKPLDLDNLEEEPEPAFLARTDGHRLFYAGKINALLGESESGKTWVALLAVKQCLDVGQKVIYLDFEDSGRGILNRLRSLGVSDEKFATFTYANPDEELKLEQRIDLGEALAEQKPDFVVVDGVNAAMTLLNLELNSNRDATFFSQQLLRPLALSGAAVCTIDHVPKSKDNRGNYAIGAQAKRADVNGAAISVSVVQPFGRGMMGELHLKVTKDRPGHVRAISKEATNAGRVLLKSSPDGSVSMVVEAPPSDSNRTRPTNLMEKISKVLEASTSPLSKSSVIKEVKGKTEWIMVACQVLIDEKFIAIENGARNSLNLKLLKPFREADDLSSAIPAWSFDNENSETA